MKTLKTLGFSSLLAACVAVGGGATAQPYQKADDVQDMALIYQGGSHRLDWTAEAWRSRLEGLPAQPPPLPANEELHPAYALCRLLLMHPAPLERQPMEMVRRVLKLTAQDGALKRAIPALHGLCAQRLRRGEALPSAAGGILAAWLAGQERKGETV